MPLDQFSRTAMLFGAESIKLLRKKRIAVFGVGGVGGYAAEALIRSGVGALDIFDDDRICLTNLNRQIIALRSTVGLYKADVMKDRLADINPEADIAARKLFYCPDTADSVNLENYDYIVDTVDTVTAKIELIIRSQKIGIPIISCMGTANKINPTLLEIADIYDTDVCPLARVMRRELRRRGVSGLKVLYSRENPVRPVEDMGASCRGNCICPPGTARTCIRRRHIPGSNAFVPPAAGLIIAGEIVRDLISGKACQTHE